VSNAVVVGATSGVGRALARRLAAAGTDLVLAGRDGAELDVIIGDLRLRHSGQYHGVPVDITDPNLDCKAFARDCAAMLDAPIDALFIPAGGAREDDLGPNLDVIGPITHLNYVGPARLGAAFGAAMQEARKGALVFFSSIAAAAPRAQNAAYSAAKAALESYAVALRHSLEPHGVTVITIALGYVDTPQSFGMQLQLPVASPEVIAERLITLSRGSGGLYHLPRFWWLITTTLRALPWPIYRRLFRERAPHTSRVMPNDE
jgi:NAD(P)-dependent dehydrogenase (short-subunit alcohol dehydrogenase family)